MARAGLLDVRRRERRRDRSRRALRIDFESQFHGPSGAGRAHASRKLPWLPRAHWRGISPRRIERNRNDESRHHDTDLIIRIERISQLVRGQLGPYLLETLRYRGDGPPSGEREDFVLNRPEFRDARTILGGNNFGCGSSREMAVWALEEAGIRCVIAPSFGDIFDDKAAEFADVLHLGRTCLQTPSRCASASCSAAMRR